MSKNTLTVAQGQPVNPLKWFEYRQNNSGGAFHVDADAGIGHYVWVQALNADEANRRAEQIGLYFDGEGDCSCCGDRWSDAWSDDKGQTEEPTYQGGEFMSRMNWDTTYAHRYDGTFYQVTGNEEIG